MTFRGRRADLMLGAYQWYARRAAIHPKSKTVEFSAFGDGSIMCFPPAALFGERAIRVGRDTMIGPYVSLSAGMAPTQELLSDRIVEIGDRVLIGRNSSIVGHFHIVIEDDVFSVQMCTSPIRITHLMISKRQSENKACRRSQFA